MNTPPKFLLWLLEMLSPANRPDLTGDFLELYEERLNMLGRRQANWRFARDIITVIPFKFIVKQSYQPAANMFTTNLKIARRNLVKNKLYSFINVAGLSVSLAACILITLFVRDELSYDKHFMGGDRVYRVAGNYYQSGQLNQNAATTFMMLPMLEGNVAGVDLIARFRPRWETIQLDADHQFTESTVLYADSTFFDVFPVPFLVGDPTTSLDDPSSVVIDKQTAVKYFGTENAMGKFIQLQDKLFKVSGVMENLSVNTHFTASIVFPISGVKQWFDPWVTTNPSGYNFYTYIKGGPDFDPVKAEPEINKIFAKHWPENDPPTFFLQPLTSIHLESNLKGEVGVNGRKTTVYVFAGTALIILLLACINYINLSIAGSLQRFKEVGMKRVLGSTTGAQVSQFQTESFMITITGAVFAILISALAMPFFNNVSGKVLALNVSDWQLGIGVLGVVVFLGIFAGLFPPIMLLRMKTSAMLSGAVSLRRANPPLRNVLIIFQFSIAIALITSTMIIVSQMNFIRNKDLGMVRENVVILPMQFDNEAPEKVAAWFETSRSEFLRSGSVLGVAASTVKITNQVGGWRPYSVPWQKDDVTVPTTNVSHDFFETMGVTFVAGRNFSREFPSDATEAYIINESAAQYLRMENPVGSRLEGASFTGKEWFSKKATVIGVVKDVQFGTLHRPAQPIVFNLGSKIADPLSWIEVRIKRDDIPETMAHLENVWHKIAPDKPFQFEFLDQSIAESYEAERRFLKLFITFSTLSIMIGCLGLFGLTAFMTRRRTKEIGIRKIVGASTPRLIGLVSRDFLILVLISNAIGWPFAYFLMQNWLQNFAYRTTMSPWLFVVTGIGAVIIAFAAILFHALQASRANPVNALKHE